MKNFKLINGPAPNVKQFESFDELFYSNTALKNSTIAKAILSFFALSSNKIMASNFQKLYYTGCSFLLALMLFNCNTPSNLLQDGDYDEAVYKAIENLQKSKKKKEKDIIVVEEAFRKITAKDMAAIESLKTTGNPADWVKINKLHNDIKERQELISPYLPLISSKTRYKADFRFVRITPLELDSRNKAAQYYYTGALENMEGARLGDKAAARNAYRKFSKVQSYFNSFEQTNSLMNEAHEIGIDKVLFDLKDNSFGYTPFYAKEELSFFDEQSLNDTWTKYFTVYNAPTDIDFRVEVDITEVDMSPERVEYFDYDVSKKLFKTIKVPANAGSGSTITTKPRPRPTVVTNTNNSPKNDRPVAASNDRPDRPQNDKPEIDKPDTDKPTKPEMVTKKVPYWVKARVFDTQITKAAYMSARVRFLDAKNGQVLSSEHVAVEEQFLHLSSTFRGDKRALPNDVRCRLNTGIITVPRDSEMLLNTATLLKNKIGKFVRAEDNIVML